ncbi:MAG: hypothetical protein WA115_05395 [Polynucleobacter sp.]
MAQQAVSQRESKMSQVYGRGCQIDGCSLPRKSGKKYCSKHEHGFHLKGDPMQLSIKISHLKRSTEEIQELLEENKSNPSLGDLKLALGERWVILGKAVDKYLKQHADGAAGSKGVRKGYQVLQSLLLSSSMDEALLLWSSFQRFEDDLPGMFVNQRSYRHQLVKHVRRISHFVDPALINKRTGKPIVKYVPEMSVPEVNTVYELLNQVFGVSGYQFSKAISKRKESKEELDKRVRAALVGIT